MEEFFLYLSVNFKEGFYVIQVVNIESTYFLNSPVKPKTTHKEVEQDYITVPMQEVESDEIYL